ncbi:MAG: FixH family protein [Gallionella sp.]|jgi:hypothetical protein
MISQKNKYGWRNPWVLGLLAIMLAGVLINMRFIWNVLSHPVRLLDDNYSVREHNQYDAKWVQQQSARSTLGWQTKLGSPQQLQNDSLAKPGEARFILMASPADLQLELQDRDGQPISGGKVEIQAQWPGDPTFDFIGALYETKPGHYDGSLKFSRAGNWDLLIKVERDGSQFDTEQKVFVAIPKQP